MIRNNEFGISIDLKRFNCKIVLVSFGFARFRFVSFRFVLSNIISLYDNMGGVFIGMTNVTAHYNDV